VPVGGVVLDEPPGLPPVPEVEPAPPGVPGVVPAAVGPVPAGGEAATELAACEPEELAGGELEPEVELLEPNAPVISEALRKKSLSTAFSACGFHARSRRSLINAVSSVQAGMVVFVIRTFDVPTS
jgi:hypothetical protein